MCEPAYLVPEILETIRGMGLNMWPETHAGWKLLGYIDWLEQRLEETENGE